MKGFTVFPVVVRTHLEYSVQHYQSPHTDPKSQILLRGPSLEGLANHTRTGLLLPFLVWYVLARLGYRLNKGSVQCYCKIRINTLFLFGMCYTRDVHFGLGGPDLIST